MPIINRTKTNSMIGFSLNFISIPISFSLLFFFRIFRLCKSDLAKHLNPSSFIPHLYQDLPPIGNKLTGKAGDSHGGSSLGHDLDIAPSVIPSFGSKLGLLLPDPAPDVAPTPETLPAATTTTPFGVSHQSKYRHNIPTTTNSHSFELKCRLIFLFDCFDNEIDHFCVFVHFYR